MAEERFKTPLAVFVILQKDGKVWMQRRANTGYRDGEYDLPSGHVEAMEAFSTAALREVKEEAGVVVEPEYLVIKHVMHNNLDSQYVNVFFSAQKYQGEPSNAEPLKCDQTGWFPMTELPQPMVPHVQLALRHIQENLFYSEEGWNK